MEDPLFDGLVAEEPGDAPQEQDPFVGPETFIEGEEEPGQQGQEEPEEAADPSRYYQSMYDRSQAELQRMAQQQQLLMQQLQLTQQQVQGGQAPVNPAQASGELAQSPQKPVRPQKPQRYDPIDATSDPNSESWQYREATENYTEQMAEYMDSLQQSVVRKAQEQAERQARETRISSVRGQLMNTYGMSDEQVTDFWQTMDAPESLAVDNLVKLYKLIKGEPIQTTGRPRSRMPIPPVPSPKGGSGPKETGSLEDRIMDDMIRKQSRTNIF